MGKPRAIHYDILQSVALLQLSGVRLVPVENVLSCLLEYDRPKVLRAVRAMTKDNWSPDGAWLEMDRRENVALTGIHRDSGEDCTGGWGEYQAAYERPALPQETYMSWEDEALTGICANGEQSDITRAALPTCGRIGRYTDPEQAAMKANRQFWPDEWKEE